VKSRLQEAELLASDPSEREFRRLKDSLQNLTYEESISALRDFTVKYPQSGRVAEARALLDENQTHKNAADSLYNFGHAYFEEGKYSVALGRYDKLIKEFPRSRWIPQAQKEYEQTLEELQQ
jgi:outer membrane protein assembly factor BamD (BamD/ComL family)